MFSELPLTIHRATLQVTALENQTDPFVGPSMPHHAQSSPAISTASSTFKSTPS